MQPAVRPRTILLPRRALLLFIAFILAAFLTLPAVAEYLGPDRTTTVFVEVRDPDHDVWTLTHVDPFDGLPDVCLVIHTCEEHPSIERQQALCGWVANNSGCDEAFKTEEQTVLLPEATIAGALQNCSLVDGWCTTSPTLHLTANEPVAGEAITLIEGTRNGEPFACSGVVCDVPLLEGSNEFTFWALSTWGDSSQMGTFSALVDSLGPILSIPDAWYVWEPLAIGVDDGQIGVDRVKLTIDGGSFGNRVYEWTLGNLPSDFIWDRHFGEIIAPIGEYPVTVKAWDLLGNSTTAAGLILIPPPEEPESAEEVSGPVSEPPPTEAPEPTSAPSASGLSVEPSPTSEPLAALVGRPAASIGSAEPATTTTSTEGGSGALLWGAAALAAAASATAYALNRRKAREAEIEKMRKEAAKAASQEAFTQRLRSLRERAEAVVAPIRNAIIASAAAVVAAAAAVTQTVESIRDRLNSNPEATGDDVSEPGAQANGDSLAVSEGTAASPHQEVVDRTGSSATPSTSPGLPNELFEILPGFDFTPQSIRQPVIDLGVFELGSHHSWTVATEGATQVGMTPEKFTHTFGNVTISGGWEGNSIGISVHSQAVTQELAGGDLLASESQSGSMKLRWDGWRTTVSAQYNSVNIAVQSSGDLPYSGSGSQGFYLEERPVQALVGLVVVGVVILGAAFGGPQLAERLSQLGTRLLQPFPVP